MIDVVVDQPPLGFDDRLLDRMQLLSELDATTTLIEHLDDSPHVSFGALEALDDFRVGLMGLSVCHML
jgi:hypothetical protein